MAKGQTEVVKKKVKTKDGKTKTVWVKVDAKTDTVKKYSNNTWAPSYSGIGDR